MDAVTAAMSNDPKKRTPGIKMIGVGCHVKGIHLDGRIVDGVELNVEFCLRLPQHAWDLASDDVSLIISTVKSPATGTIQAYASNSPRTPERKKWIYADAKDFPSNNMEDPIGGKADTDTAVTVPAENYTGNLFASPGMKKLFKQNFGTKTGCGKFNFFDTQSAFDQIFGTQPNIYRDFENNKDVRDAKRAIMRFIDKCRLDIFIAVFRMDYFGTDNDDINFYVQEFCNDIASLHQTWRD